ncbi:hypothetical protein [Paraburkholderia sp. BR14320]|uniref:hypothetical protein n=1 Tax=unclassified Paraburkholderia TaxID=2615204 RepID=UPI0034CD8D37
MSIQLPIALPPFSTWQENEKLWSEDVPLDLVRPYTDKELLTALEEWGTPDKGRVYIIQSRLHAPTRKVQGRARNVVSHYNSHKMGRRVATESRNVEFPAVLRYDLDVVTREFYCQPMQVGIPTTIKRKSKDGIETEYRVVVPYTPDILRLKAAGPLVEEWKNEEKLIKLAEKYPWRFHKSEGDATWHCPEREKFFAEMGITYCLRSSSEHNPIFTSNLDFLRDYLVADSTTLTADTWSAIERIIGKAGAMSLARLNENAFDDETPWNDNEILPTPPGRFRVDDVLQAIAERRLWVDLDYDDLSDAPNVIVCASREQLEGVIWRRPPPHAVTTYFLFNVQVGSEFMFRGQSDVYTVSAMPAGSVLYNDSSSKLFGELTEQQFETLLHRKDIQLLSTMIRCRLTVPYNLLRISYEDHSRTSYCW